MEELYNENEENGTVGQQAAESNGTAEKTDLIRDWKIKSTIKTIEAKRMLQQLAGHSVEWDSEELDPDTFYDYIGVTKRHYLICLWNKVEVMSDAQLVKLLRSSKRGSLKRGSLLQALTECVEIAKDYYKQLWANEIRDFERGHFPYDEIKYYENNYMVACNDIARVEALIRDFSAEPVKTPDW